MRAAFCIVVLLIAGTPANLVFASIAQALVTALSLTSVGLGPRPGKGAYFLTLADPVAHAVPIAGREGTFLRLTRSKSANRPALFATTSARSCARVRPLKFAYSCLELLDLVRGRQHEVGDLVPTLISKIGLALAQLSDQKLARARISYLVSNRMLAHVLTDAPVQRLARRCADQDRYWGEHQVANYQTVLILNLEKTP